MLKIKRITLLAIGICVSLFVTGCNSLVNSADNSPANTGVQNNSLAAKVKDVSNQIALNASYSKSAANIPKKAEAVESLPRKINDNAAVSPVYQINSKNCQNKDEQGSEGDEFVRKCKGYGNYSLWFSGFDALVNYRIESDDPKSEFVAYLAPLETGDASEYVRADRFVQKLVDEIEWILDEQGKPYAVFVHASFYKNTGGVKNSVSPKNKIAEFVLLRGLKGYKEIDTDIPTKDTAYNPDEWARKIAYEYIEKNKR